MLRNIPETVRKGKEPRASPYKPQRWRGANLDTLSVPTATQSIETKAVTTKKRPLLPPLRHDFIPTKKLSLCQRGRVRTENKRNLAKEASNMAKRNRNFRDHGLQHLNRLEFLRVIRIQLVKDRGRDADAAPLYLSGSIGSLFKACKELHKLGIFHGDACDTVSGNIMVVDFERADVRCRPPLGSLSSNTQPQKRKRGMLQKQEKGNFTNELESVVERVSRCITTVRPEAATYAAKMVRDV
ncbi:hypothetical protein BDP55DRAFT_393821 [Colletotrichum godetiae]|uniref:Uncharacterized protein n=1 Tax=Colletotrichum godetiae TaxID=1209918 RepID=A0AAJ0A8K0_9PEZI|nr:uncharacterized protein BDP55DRAFT_393821 [Colletotrichum godetiae]KAK1658521.1 hypothetical protein BDP55DRAFT_393821 [Colletotrichum godetiae]